MKRYVAVQIADGSMDRAELEHQRNVAARLSQSHFPPSVHAPLAASVTRDNSPLPAARRPARPQVRFAALVLLSFLVGGVLIGCLGFGLSPVDSAYFVVFTLTTAGYEMHRKLDDQQKCLLMLFVLAREHVFFLCSNAFAQSH